MCSLLLLPSCPSIRLPSTSLGAVWRIQHLWEGQTRPGLLRQHAGWPGVEHPSTHTLIGHVQLSAACPRPFQWHLLSAVVIGYLLPHQTASCCLNRTSSSQSWLLLISTSRDPPWVTLPRHIPVFMCPILPVGPQPRLPRALTPFQIPCL